VNSGGEPLPDFASAAVEDNRVYPIRLRNQ